MVFCIFCRSSIIFEHVIYPHEKCEEGLLLLVDYSVIVLGETIVHAIEAIYVSFVNVCMSLFSEVMMFKQVVHCLRFYIVVSRQVNVAVVATA